MPLAVHFGRVKEQVDVNPFCWYGLYPNKMTLPFPWFRTAWTVFFAGSLITWKCWGIETTGQSTNHWAYQSIRRMAPPRPGHPVDAFIQSMLSSHGLEPSPAAEPSDLLRRLYLDLIGLPPSPEELAAYLADRRPDRYEQLVDRLLASPRYGERWARQWLDLARFSESTGFEYDRLRDNAWPYRDYVIRSFNSDKPYDQFMREQIAGDILKPLTTDGILGPSLLVCGAYDQAGNAQANATQRAITREEEMEDMLSVVGQTFLGLTVNCARCHDHKFDPIPQKDYFRLKSVFDGVKHGERPVEGDFEASLRRGRKAAAQAKLDQARGELAQIDGAAWKVFRDRHPAVPAHSTLPALMRWDFANADDSPPSGEFMGGAFLQAGTLELSKAGAFFQSQPLTEDVREKTLEAWVRLEDLQQQGGAAISLETRDGSNFDAITFGEREPGKWTAGSAGFQRTKDLMAPVEDVAGGEWVHMAIVYGPDNQISVYRNGKPYGTPYRSDGPLPTFKAGESHVVLGMRHHGGGNPWLVGGIRLAALYDRALSPSEVMDLFQSGLSGQAGLSKAELLAALTAEQRVSRDRALAEINAANSALTDADKPRQMAYAGVRVQPEPTHRLKRGDVKSPEEIVSPGALSAISTLSPDLGLPPDAPEGVRRARFADWLCDPRNPLPARVMVNRLWQCHFGQGLVATPSDFGANGARPSHPELLDWLASTFIDGGWSLKSVHRWMVTSATYRQSSRANAKAQQVDADDRWLWRFPPRRLDAEMVRDAMLAVSGEINLEVGGPSFRPFTTTDFNATFYFPFDRGDAEFNRRTVYRMNVNSGKDPFLDTFDCPDPSVKTPRRNVTTTPLQALSLMNSSFVQRQSERLAVRARNQSVGGETGAIQAVYRLVLGRSPEEDEVQRAAEAVRERGLPEFCWALLNSTEFLYVR